MDDIKFCSQCKYAKLEETDVKLYIVCSRPQNAQNFKSNVLCPFGTIHKRLNARACGYFVETLKNR